MSDEQIEVAPQSSTFKQAATNGNGVHDHDEQLLETAATSALPKSDANQQEGRVAADDKVVLQIQIHTNSRNNLTFFSGEIVRGHVVLTLAEAMEVQSLDLFLIGGATVGWTRLTPFQQPEMNSIRQAVEYYVNEAQNILGILPGEYLLVSKGSHTFHFQFRVPQNAPASFSGTFGNVNYIIKAVLKTNGSINSYVARLNVQKHLEVQSFTKFLSAAELRIKKTYQGKGIKSMMTGPVEVFFRVSKMGYAFGETIDINGHALNRSYAEINSIVVQLLQRCIYSAQGARLADGRIISKVEDIFTVEHNAIRRWKNVRLPIPEDCPPSYLDGCKLIETYYELAFFINFKSARPLSTTLPIVIGLRSSEARIDPEAVPSTSFGTMKTQIFDFGTINSNAFAVSNQRPASQILSMSPNSPPADQNGHSLDPNFVANMRQRPEEQRHAQQQSYPFQRALKQFDDSLE